MALSSPPSSKGTLQPGKSNNTLALTVLTSLFFMWGFITCMNDILIPTFKEIFDLNYSRAFLVQFAFFGAYFLGSLVYFLIGVRFGDPIQKVGYKNGILAGLIVSAVACALFYPAAALHSYNFFLGALFLLGIGFTLLQIAANPYVAILGPEETASSRLNLAQGFNSFGTTIAPLIGGFLIFELLAGPNGALTVEALKGPYLTFAAIFLLVAIIIKLTPLPHPEAEEIVPGAGALRYPHLVLGMFAIFFYVGGEVTVGSALINFFEMPDIMGMEKSRADIFLAFYWGGAMIGRFIGAISLSDMKNEVKKLGLMAGAALLTFLVIYLSAYAKSKGELTLGEVAPFLLFILVNLVGFRIGKSMPARTLAVFAMINLLLLLVVIFTGGVYAFWCAIGIGLFNSIMFSNIFTLAIEGLGKYKSQGSSLLVMMILGGALVPALQGVIADASTLQLSFAVALVCYAYLFFYGFKGYNLGREA